MISQISYVYLFIYLYICFAAFKCYTTLLNTIVFE
jgi:hypothetical protein